MSENSRSVIDTMVRSLPRGLLVKTKFVPCTNTKGTRVTASSNTPSGKCRVTLGWDHMHDGIGNHYLAAEALAEKLSADNKYFTYRVSACGWDESDYYYFLLEAIARD